MRRSISVFVAALGILLASHAATAQEGFDFTGRHYAQLTAEHLDGSDDGLGFGADRIRTRLEATRGPVTGGIMLDFGVEDLGEREPGRGGGVLGRCLGSEFRLRLCIRV